MLTRRIAVAVAALMVSFLVVSSANALTIKYQPGPTDGKDAYVFSHYSGYNVNYGTGGATHTWWGADPPNAFSFNTMSFFEFDLSTLPAAGDVQSVSLNLYQTIGRSYGWNYGVQSPHMDLYLIGGAWDENSLTWNTAPGIGATAVASTQLVFPIQNPTDGYYEFFADWIHFDITSIYKDWQSGALDNFGLAMHRREPFGENAIGHLTYTSDNTESELRPMLLIETTGNVVPEPVTLAGMLLAVGGLGRYMRRRAAK